MSEDEELAALKETFNGIIEANLAIVRDAGLARFERSAQEARTYLIEKYITRKMPLSEADVRRLNNVLNEGWSHHGESTVITGRLYLDDESYEEEADKILGEADIDDESGDTFYTADGVEVVSQGVEIKPIYADGGVGELEDFQIVYTFSIKDAFYDTPILYAHPNDLFQHEYTTPTPDEAAVRLESKWPQQYQKIKTFLRPTGKHSLPRRLGMLTRSLQHDLTASEEFRQLAQIYIDDATGLDDTLPYIVTVRGELSGFDGEDPDNPEEGEEWVNLFTDESMSMMAFYPSFRFVQGDDDHVEAYFVMATFNSEDGDEEEYVRVNVKNIEQFRSTRAMRPFVSRSTEYGIEVLGQNGSTSDSKENEGNKLDEAASELTKGQVIRRIAAERKTDIPIVSEMKRLDDALQEIIERVKEGYRAIYGSEKEARSVAQELIKNDIIRIYQSLGLSRQFVFKISGRGVRVPTQTLGQTSSGDEQSVSFTIDTQRPVSPINPGETLTGLLHACVPTIEEVKVEDGSIVGYRANPSLLMATPQFTRSLLNINGVSAVDITIDKKLLVSLNGTADIKVLELESYNEAHQALDQFAYRYGNLPIVRQIRRLHNTLMKEVRVNEDIDLKSVKHLSTVGREVQKLAREGKDVRLIIEAFDAFFIGSVVQLRSALYTKTNTSFEEVTPNNSGVLFSTEIIDVRDDVFNDDIAFVLRSDEHGVVYTPLGSITKYMF